MNNMEILEKFKCKEIEEYRVKLKYMDYFPNTIFKNYIPTLKNYGLNINDLGKIIKDHNRIEKINAIIGCILILFLISFIAIPIDFLLHIFFSVKLLLDFKISLIITLIYVLAIVYIEYTPIKSKTEKLYQKYIDFGLNVLLHERWEELQTKE